jgi:hypothetical protein
LPGYQNGTWWEVDGHSGQEPHQKGAGVTSDYYCGTINKLVTYLPRFENEPYEVPRADLRDWWPTYTRYIREF